MRLTMLAVIVACGMTPLTAGTARAADASSPGVELGLRSGYSLPFGSAAGASGGGTAPALSDTVSGVIPIWIDAGYRLNPNIYIGGYFQYGIALINNDKTGCGMSGASCSVNDVQFGANLHYHLLPDQTFDPWAGVGIGYEILSFSQAGLSQNRLSGNFNGFQFLNLQIGGDYKAMPNFGIGPFAMFGLGQYSNCSISGASSCTIQNTALHEWLTIGIRGEYDIVMGN